MKTALYMRVSTEEQAKEGYSLQAQRRKLTAYCEAHDWSIVEIYSDEGITGSSLEKRPQATKMMEDAKQNKFENILILKVDRLARNTRDLLTIVDTLKKHKVHLNAVEETIDYDTPTGKMMLTILGSFAELERSTITQRTNAGKEQKRLNGYKVNGGFIPFGLDYMNGMFIANDNKNVVETIFALYLKGFTANKICQYLQEKGIKSPNGSDTWQRSQMMRMLKNETYKGFLRGKKANNIEPIVTEDTFDTVNSLIQSRSVNHARRYSKDEFWFGDVAYCGVCGWKLRCRSNEQPQKRRYYMCCYNSYNHIHSGDDKAHSSRMENKKLETLFLEYFNKFDLSLADMEIKADEEQIKIQERKIASLTNKKNTILNRKKRALELLLDKKIEDEEYSTVMQNITSDIQQVESQIALEQAELDQLKSNPIDKQFTQAFIETHKVLEDYWKNWNDHQKRLFISSAIERIEIITGKITKIEFKI